MKRAVLLLVAVAGIAAAGTISVNFGALLSAINITAPNLTTIDGVTLQYDPQNPAIPACGFDENLGGTQFFAGPVGCVGAHVDNSGVIGTTEGVYLLTIAGLVQELQFSYGLFTMLPLPQVYGVSALLMSGGALSAAVTATGDVNTLSYTGAAFDQAQLYFKPFDPLVDGAAGTTTYGQTLATIHDVSYTPIPEPGAIALVGCGLLGLAGWRSLKDKRIF